MVTTMVNAAALKAMVKAVTPATPVFRLSVSELVNVVRLEASVSPTVVLKSPLKKVEFAKNGRKPVIL